jgi:hypothetical protein
MKFEPNTIIESRSICDSNCIFEISIIKRTDKTVAFMDHNFKTRRSKIHTDSEGVEFIMPDRHSFAPIFRASNAFGFVENVIS